MEFPEEIVRGVLTDMDDISDITPKFAASLILNYIKYLYLTKFEFGKEPIVYCSWPLTLQKALDSKHHFFVYDAQYGAYRCDNLEKILGDFSQKLTLWTEDNKGKYHCKDYYANTYNFNKMLKELSIITGCSERSTAMDITNSMIYGKKIIVPQKAWKYLENPPYYNNEKCKDVVKCIRPVDDNSL